MKRWGLVSGNRQKVRIHYSNDRKPGLEDVLELYRSLGWSSADKPTALHQGLLASHSLVTAWETASLVGLVSSLSDGHLLVYFTHLLVRPDYQGRGIGTELMIRMMARYKDFHQQTVLADGRAVDFYKTLGFVRAGSTEPLWIFNGREHD
jgi:ribosomal protein S18 acetylase RimI-like enzyme